MCRRFDSSLLRKWSTETYFLIGNADANRIVVRIREKFLNYHNLGQAYLTTIHHLKIDMQLPDLILIK